jgi:pilus assembly protein CpaB
MNRRPLAVALFLAACATALLFVYLRRFEREVSGGPPVRLLTLLKTVERGAVIGEDALATRDVPLAYVEDRAVRASERAKVLGLQASSTLEPQQTLLWSDLAITTEARELSALVQPGKRGVTVRAAGFDDTPGSVLIHPGDYVDVIVTSSGPGEAREATSAVLLQRVLVLAVGEQTGPAPVAVQALAQARREERALTLSLSLAEAQRLALATERGHLSVAVRNAADPAVQADVPDVRASALFAPIPPAPSSAPRGGSGPIVLGGLR